MSAHPKRPINLDLTSLKYPPMAIASILHRISGMILFLLCPILLYFFSLSLHSETTFYYLLLILSNPWCKLLMWVFSAALIYHLFAGIRHLMMDMGVDEGLDEGRRSAVAVMFLSIVLIIILGIWIW